MGAIVYVFSGVAAIQLFYFLFIYSRLLFRKEKPQFQDEQLPPVSVIVCARSEAKNIMELVPVLLAQNYPLYEVLVVNDRSWDDTKEILEALKVKYPQLRFIHIEENERHHFSGKKMALTLGIKGAAYEQLVFTDADCRPIHENWLRHMVSGFQNGKTIVLGYSPYKRKPGFLNKLIRFDAYTVAMNYLNMAKAGLPYMGVGRNLAYTKTQHFAKGGFKSHYHIASGDDDLFVNQNATKGNTAIVIHAESAVESIPKTNFEEWRRQKTRHMTSSSLYKSSHKLFIGMYYSTLLGFYALMPFTILLNNALFITLTFFGARTLLQIITFRGSSKWLGNKDVAFLSTFYEIILSVLTLNFYIRSLFAKKDKWN